MVSSLRRRDAVLAAEGALQFGIQIVDSDRSEETQPAQVHGEQRDFAPADGPCGRKQRAVAAQHHHQVAAFRTSSRGMPATPAYSGRSPRRSAPRCPGR